MALLRRNIFDFNDFERGVQSLFSEFRNNSQTQLATFNPSFSVKENDKGYLVHAELPGIKKEDIYVELKNGNLLIKGEKKEEKKEDNDKYHLYERKFGSFERGFRVPSNVKPTDVQASMNDGVLEVFVPKIVEEANEAKIEIK